MARTIEEMRALLEGQRRKVTPGEPPTTPQQKANVQLSKKNRAAALAARTTAQKIEDAKGPEAAKQRAKDNHIDNRANEVVDHATTHMPPEEHGAFRQWAHNAFNHPEHGPTSNAREAFREHNPNVPTASRKLHADWNEKKKADAEPASDRAKREIHASLEDNAHDYNKPEHELARKTINSIRDSWNQTSFDDRMQPNAKDNHDYMNQLTGQYFSKRAPAIHNAAHTVARHVESGNISPQDAHDIMHQHHYTHNVINHERVKAAMTQALSNSGSDKATKQLSKQYNKKPGLLSRVLNAIPKPRFYPHFREDTLDTVKRVIAEKRQLNEWGSKGHNTAEVGGGPPNLRGRKKPLRPGKYNRHGRKLYTITKSQSLPPGKVR